MSEDTTPSVKEVAASALAALPDDVSWDAVLYELYVRSKIERGLRDIDEGRTVSHEEAVRRLGSG